MLSIAVYIGAALAEIAGCFAFWAWLRMSRSPLWLMPGCLSLVLFAFLLTRVDSVGGAMDAHTEIVKGYRNRYRAANPDFECRYFEWTDRSEITALLNGDAKGGHVSLVGHSFGGDTCFWRMGHVPTVDLLISVDPVATFQRDWTSIRAGAKVWLNIRAEADLSHLRFDDFIAGAGGQYSRPPAPGTPAGPNYSIFANTNHGNFGGMMAVAVRGISGRLLLGGNSVG